MTLKEAEALQRAVSIAGRSAQDNSSLILLGYYKKPTLLNFFRLQGKININLSKAGLSFPNILTLIDIAVFYDQEIESTELNIGQEYNLSFNNIDCTLRAKKDGLILTYYKFTQTGDELTTLSNAQLNTNYKQELDTLFSSDFEVIWSK